MNKTLLALGLAGLCLTAATGAGVAQKSTTVRGGSHYAFPLPKQVTTNEDWLDAGNVAPVGSENKYMHVDNGDALSEIQVGPNLDQSW